jgi:hypothetical protein
VRKIAKLRHMKKPCIDYTTLNPHHTYIVLDDVEGAYQDPGDFLVER